MGKVMKFSLGMAFGITCAQNMSFNNYYILRKNLFLPLSKEYNKPDWNPIQCLIIIQDGTLKSIVEKFFKK